MYFEKMPMIYYDFQDKDGNPVVRILKDITTNIRFIKSELDNISVYDEYDIVDDETPELISTRIYGTPKYHWVIMLMNEIYDYRSDLPLNYNTLSQYVTDKYGAGNEYAIHHWEAAVDTSSGALHIVMPTFPGATSVSNFAYEEGINESKRRIRLLSKDVLDAVVKQYSAMFS